MAISSESVVNCENTVLTFPESVLTLFVSVFIATPKFASPHELKFGSILPSDLFTMKENLSRGEFNTHKILPL